MLLDVRTYKTRPGCVPAQLELYKKYGYPVQLRYMGEPLCYAVAETGELNTFMHVWVYDNAADREDKRARMAADPDWKASTRRERQSRLPYRAEKLPDDSGLPSRRQSRRQRFTNKRPGDADGRRSKDRCPTIVAPSRAWL